MGKKVSGWVGGNFPPSESNTSIDPTINTLLLLCVFHLPASDCYSLHFCLAHHHYWEPTFHGMLWDGKTITSGLTESYWGKQALWTISEANTWIEQIGGVEKPPWVFRVAICCPCCPPIQNQNMRAEKLRDTQSQSHMMTQTQTLAQKDSKLLQMCILLLHSLHESTYPPLCQNYHQERNFVIASKL